MFFRHSRVFSSKTFVLPVIIFTILYNVPKFFELYVKKEVVTKTLNCSDVIEDLSYEEHHENCTLNEMGNVTVPDLDENQNLRYKISIAATELRKNQIYIRVYILWINLIFQVSCIDTFQGCSLTMGRGARPHQYVAQTTVKVGFVSETKRA